nr:ribonuclease H-like domain-containing protein [Tanacetum cinerariifolium]
MALSKPPELGFNDFLAMLIEPVSITAKLTLSTSLVQRIISLLHAEFAVTDLGTLNYFLGMSAMRTTSGMFLSETNYATEILEQAKMLNCNPCRTPTDIEKQLGPERSPVTDPTLYRSLVGSLQYLTFTRPDLSYAVQLLCLYIHVYSTDVITVDQGHYDNKPRSSTAQCLVHQVMKDATANIKTVLNGSITESVCHSKRVAVCCVLDENPLIEPTRDDATNLTRFFLFICQEG